MNIYNTYMYPKRVVSNRLGALVDDSFFIFASTEPLDDYTEVIQYWENTVDQELMGLEFETEGELT